MTTTNHHRSGTGTGTGTGVANNNKLPPPTTLCMICLMGLLFLWEQTLMSSSSSQQQQLYTMCPRNVIYLHEYYRILTSCLLHANIMHIGMNMMSFVALGRLLEQRHGTVPFFIMVVWMMIWTSCMYLIIAYSAHLFIQYDQWMYDHSIGFSGVLFHMVVLECSASASASASASTSTRSVFGIVNVPTVAYPWVLLLVLQFIMPNLSFIGHLSGIVTGTLQTHGYMDTFCLPSPSYWIHLDDEYHESTTSTTTSLVRRIQTMNGYVMATSTSWTTTTTTTTSSTSSTGGIINIIYHILQRIVKYVRDVVEVIVVCIFGRGRNLNSNIRIWQRRRTTTTTTTTTNEQRQQAERNNDQDDDDNDLELQQQQGQRGTNNFPSTGGRRLGRGGGEGGPRLPGRAGTENVTRENDGDDEDKIGNDDEMEPLVETSEVV
jgi:membrane associated rhomboid family serine protease